MKLSPFVITRFLPIWDNAVAQVRQFYFYFFYYLTHAINIGSRTFVHEDIYAEFVKKATAMAAARKVGNPFDEGVEQGPQVN